MWACPDEDCICLTCKPVPESLRKRLQEDRECANCHVTKARKEFSGTQLAKYVVHVGLLHVFALYFAPHDVPLLGEKLF